MPPVSHSNYDLAVIGGGLAGLVTAARAAELGVRVVILERGEDELYACNSRYSGGIFHVSYHDPKLEPAVLSTAMEMATAGIAEPELIDAIAGNAGRSIDWLRSAGARFMRGVIDWHAWVLAPPRPLTPGNEWKGRGPDVLLRTLSRRVVERNGHVLLGARASSLIMRDGTCHGVLAERGGARIEIESTAVVIADGGFQGNAALFRRHIGPRPDRVIQRGAGTAVGDGLTMALEAGAAASTLDRFYGHVLSRDAFHNDRLTLYPQIDAVAAASVIVDRDGRRLLDEGLGGIFIANRLAALDDPLCGSVIFDSKTWDGPGRQAQIAPNPHLEVVGGTLYRADTLAALAGVAGIDGKGLAETVAAYNAALDAGRFERLSPARSEKKARAWPIRQPPFFALPICAGITNTMGGIAVDGHARVKRGDGSIIDGLYAAGTATGGLEGGETAGYVGGLIKAAVLGLRVAEHAAQRCGDKADWLRMKS